jgi:signal transduction histidine kinase
LDNPEPKLKDLAGGADFRIAWILLAVVAVAIGVAFFAMSGIFALIEICLLAGIAVAAVFAVYQAATRSRGTTVEHGELASFFSAIDDALVVYGSDFRISFFNHPAQKLFGIAEADAIGHVLSPRDVEAAGGWRTLAQVIFPSLAPRVIVKSAEGELPQVADVSLTDPELELRIATAPVTDQVGKPLVFMKIIRDRTPQINALRSKDEFITVASHQLRGPVTDINWALQSLAAAPELTETNKMIVANAAAASDNLLRRVEDLLSIAKMEDGQVGYSFEDTDIVAYVGTILAGLLPAARKAGIKIYYDRPAVPMPHVMIDPKRLSLAITNLLENSIRYNVENGEVTVKVDRMEGKPFVVVSVKDTGIGVPEDAIGKLFTKFYRADNAVKFQTEGSGLGLYIAKSIVEAHGGQIWAESELNRGTTISLALPTDPNLVPKHEVSAVDLL